MSDPGRGSAGAWWPISILLVGSACSGGGGGPPAAQIPALAVVDVFPADGAQAIDPRTEVRVRFSELVSGPIDLHFVVADAAGPVPGLVDGSADGRTWRWLPVFDLPRGGRIEVRALAGLTGASGARLATDQVFSFTVREHTAVVHSSIGTVEPGALAAIAWRDGRRAVGQGRTFTELAPSGAVASVLPVVGEPVAFAPAGPGSFAALAVDSSAGLVIQALHGSLNGPPFTTLLDAPPGAYGRCELVGNAGGHLAAYFYALLPGPEATDRLWWARAGTTSWHQVALPAVGIFPLRHLAIDGSGNLLVAYVDGPAARLVLLRHTVATGWNEVIDVAALPDSFAVGAAANGEALVVWGETRSEAGGEVRVLQSRRYVPSVGLLAPIELHRGAAWAQHAFVMAASGACVIVLRDGEATAPNHRLLVQRIEADGRIGTAALAYDGPATTAQALAVAPRGEAWFLFVAPDAAGLDTVTVVRSRAGTALDVLGARHAAAQPGLRIRKVALAVDDGGRAVIACHEDQPGAPAILRAVVLD